MQTDTCAALMGFVDMLMDAICVVDSEGRYVFVSAAAEHIFGYAPDELIGRQMLELVHPEDRERTLVAAADIMSGNPKLHFENRYLRKDGSIVHIMWSARWSAVDRLRIAVARDITERKRAEVMQVALFGISEAANSAEDLLSLYQHLHQIIAQLLPARSFSVALYDTVQEQLLFPYHVDEQDPTRQDPTAGALASEIAASGQALLLCPRNRERLPQHLNCLVNADSLCWLGVPLNTQRGTIGALMIKSHVGGAPYTDKDQELLQFVSNQAAAAIERKQMHERLQHMAQYDQLTRLPNRMLLQERLLGALNRVRADQGLLAVLYLDLDKFKLVNDTFGHAAGDLLLQEVAWRLSQCVRESDTVARIGGDEFAVLLERISKVEDAARVAEKILEKMNAPMLFGDTEWPIRPSIGIAHFPGNAADLAQLFKYADEAMYQAKKAGGNRFQD
ncbi:diguanylate cyclase domain-containing protein [Pseudomonas sp. Pseusp122]|uniref:sensor domain-containing protein n=1 Tax=unclassified Pseudomonas TaxID=196821 RepID=UPI0039A4F885